MPLVNSMRLVKSLPAGFAPARSAAIRCLLALGTLCLSALAQPAVAQGLRLGPVGGSTPTRESAPRAADYIVAVVNSEPITNNEVRTRMIRFEQRLAQQGQPVPPQPEFARQVLERLINEKAQLQLARENGLKIEDATVDLAEQNVARSNQIDVAEFRRRLAADHIPVAQFRQELRDQLLLTRLRERELDARVRVSDLEVEQYLRDQQNSNDPSSWEVSLAHILVAVGENASDQQVAAARDKAQRILARARAGEDFSKLAAEFSDGQGAKENGGLISLRPADRFPPAFIKAVEPLQPGGVADIVRSAAGFHIVKLVERRKGGLAGMRVTQTHVRHILLRPGPNLTETAALARMAEYKKRVESGNADFAQVARDFSQDGSARNGGDLGWAAPGLFVPEFEEAMNALKIGQISEPVVSRFGVHLIQVLERREATLSPREQREVARNIVREKKLDEAYASWAQEVRGRAFVDYRDPPQ